MFPVSNVEASFVAAFSALFAVSNPIGCALIYGHMTANLAQWERAGLSRRVAINAGIVLIAAMWAGGLVLSFFGIAADSLRIGGGLAVAAQAWRMLEDDPKDALAANEADAFYPLTVPFTTGPGTIAVAIALGSARPIGATEAIAFVLGATLAALAMATSVAVFYGAAHRLIAFLGEGSARAVMRLSAFLLLCVGIQILAQGIKGMQQ